MFEKTIADVKEEGKEKLLCSRNGFVVVELWLTKGTEQS